MSSLLGSLASTAGSAGSAIGSGLESAGSTALSGLQSAGNAIGSGAEAVGGAVADGASWVGDQASSFGDWITNGENWKGKIFEKGGVDAPTSPTSTGASTGNIEANAGVGGKSDMIQKIIDAENKRREQAERNRRFNSAYMLLQNGITQMNNGNNNYNYNYNPYSWRG